ncbi:bifunctional phosphoribosyl-AMP cyclohydrolase/phosphoribosyl-ATP diphosphatase [Mergibacter septicus]|uniref:Histidine biosynthesis bifunctional protein HisIE n=1 Tax=Mergibacter septicus TaxID=221402 RepID=A0A8D4J089_9PAST|nr:bifunctional phosphoribosyl-AMP cyclohydrolase/phosphoribosyl-ATP diphosphatase HisIE [Mergibacter septicus]AWX15482.1 bifunctional phosphoribosyl-AMP cyclohydrolase/phosphoribosyl-ATP diphosphatase [Mergibacter septicus]QDJ12961.1 bifunctional phosphoribosyl-AMP cyclohydrolase/phosphoribosyl-ATP diphosphatase [Mergibacter septicus]QDJ14735.1 bifunctional phosphoribosyl-AMP cyclohydrolase/phosphoribosyl-ATP diphosphatase [Mergibacter septicus]UTU47837.1 bifunctional phosphoribosyl-AMP cycloh
MGDKQILSEIDWQKVGQLLPVIVQNVNTAEVLMLGYMNQAALEKTLAEKRVTFFSRTKQRLWTKGETSGNFLQLVDYSLDCDRDSLLILANPLGKTCHQGTDSCFSPISAHIDWVFFSKLEQLIQQRKGADPSSSYTASLYAKGTKRIAQKVGEEGVETALAATVEDQAETISEAADLVYHLTVLLQNANLNWSAVIEKLKQRHQ